MTLSMSELLILAVICCALSDAEKSGLRDRNGCCSKKCKGKNDGTCKFKTVKFSLIGSNNNDTVGHHCDGSRGILSTVKNGKGCCITSDGNCSLNVGDFMWFNFDLPQVKEIGEQLCIKFDFEHATDSLKTTIHVTQLVDGPSLIMGTGSFQRTFGRSDNVIIKAHIFVTIKEPYSGNDCYINISDLKVEKGPCDSEIPLPVKQ